MKKLFVFTLVFFFTIINAQENTLISYSEVVKVDSTRTSDELYQQTKMWFVDVFKNSKAVIQLEDNANKTVIGEASFRYSSRIFFGCATTVGKIKYKISITCKDGRYKYEISNFYHEGKSFDFGYITIAEDPNVKFGFTSTRFKVYQEMKDDIKKEIVPLIVNLKEYMNQNKISAKEEW